MSGTDRWGGGSRQSGFFNHSSSILSGFDFLPFPFCRRVPVLEAESVEAQASISRSECNFCTARCTVDIDIGICRVHTDARENAAQDVKRAKRSQKRKRNKKDKENPGS